MVGNKTKARVVKNKVAPLKKLFLTSCMVAFLER